MKTNTQSPRISNRDGWADVPGELRPLYDAALTEFGIGNYQRALPLLGRLALALPLSHDLRPTVRASLARAFLDVGQLAAAQRELAHALAAEPNNAIYRGVRRALRQAIRDAKDT